MREHLRTAAYLMLVLLGAIAYGGGARLAMHALDNWCACRSFNCPINK